MQAGGNAQMAHIDYFFTVLSPYVYLAGTRLEQIAARHGATITYKPAGCRCVVLRARAASH
jgi:2-hydroxychromene-2-carboxylate isomerase